MNFRNINLNQILPKYQLDRGHSVHINECFKFTYPNSNLSDEQKLFYEKNGYLIVRNNVDQNLLDEIITRFNNLLTLTDPLLKNKSVQDPHLISEAQDLLHDNIFWKYCTYPNVIKIVEGIIGPNITAVNPRFANTPTPTNIDSRVSLYPLRQELQYFPFRPGNKIVTSWTALAPTDEKNGCLYVVPGSHKANLYKQENSKECKNILQQGVKDFDHFPMVNIIMNKGDTVFFHPILLHGFAPNFSKDGFAKAIPCHYAANDCYFIDFHDTRHENVAAEVRTLLRRKGIGPHYLDICQHKSRWVQGTSSVFQTLESHL